MAPCALHRYKESMKNLPSLLILALLLSFAAWFCLPGAPPASADAPHEVTIHEAQPIREISAPPASAPTKAAPTPRKPPSPLQIALQAGDLCGAAWILNNGINTNEIHIEIIQAIMAALQPSAEALEAFGPEGPYLAASVPGRHDPDAAKPKYKSKVARILWALKLGGALYTPVSPASDNPEASRALLLALQKEEPGNGFYHYFRLVQEEKLGFTKEQLRATAEEVAASSTFHSPLNDLSREMQEASWQNPALRYAFNLIMPREFVSFYLGSSVLSRLAQEQGFAGNGQIARLLTDKGMRATRSWLEAGYDSGQYNAGYSLDPNSFPSGDELEKKFEPYRHEPPLIVNAPDNRILCDPGPYEEYFYEMRRSR